jgi:putative selenium metabolism protein SsnA
MMILENCCIFDGKRIQKGSISIEGNVIERAGRVEQGDCRDHGERVDLGGRLVMPGLICAHGHAYSAFGYALPRRESSDLEGILKNFWWPLDQSLDRESIYWSAVLTGIRYLKNGVTTIIDHHASGNFVSGSLSTLAKGFGEVGIRACLSYEVTDRYGKSRAKEAIRENKRFIKRYGRGDRDEMISSLFGLHASFTLSSDTLQECREIAGDTGFHLHLAEGEIDARDSMRRFGKPLVQHLKDEGILDEKTLAAHCVYLDKKDIEAVGKTDVKVITNPRSNANNGVGIMPLRDLIKEGVTVGIGNDGLGYDMLEEAKALQLMQSLKAGRPSALSPEVLTGILFENNSKIASNLFRRGTGRISEGAYADLVVMDLKHFSGELNMVDSSLIDSVMVDGKWIIKDKFFDVEKYGGGIEKSANRVKEKFAQQDIKDEG